MTSIHTNAGAISALQTLRSINAGLKQTQGQISSGLRVQVATDNAAYWSISTTMRSDRMAISAVTDALGLGAAKVDTAYAGMKAVVEILSEFKARLVAATEDGVDKAKIQSELEQLKAQVVGVAGAASFGGQNWLNTDIENIYDIETNKASVVSSFARSSRGVSVEKIDIHLDKISLFNTTGGGLLQNDPRDVRTLGGMRGQSTVPLTSSSTVYYTETEENWMNPRTGVGGNASFYFNFPDGTPLDFNTPGAQIKFDIVLDKEHDPALLTGVSRELADMPGPYGPGFKISDVTITKATVDAVDAGWGGVISNNTDFAKVMNHLLKDQGALTRSDYSQEMPPGSEVYVHHPSLMSIQTRQMHGNGNYIELANVSSVGVSTGGLVAKSDYGEKGSGMALTFEPFALQVDGSNPDGVEVDFDFSINGAPATHHNFNRTYVNELLGKDSGAVETPEEMVVLLRSLISADWPDTVIEVSSSNTGTIIVKSDPAVDRKWGPGTSIGFSNIDVSIEPIPFINFLSIDIAKKPDLVEHYIDYIEVASKRVVAGASILGALATRIDMQSDFATKMISTNEKGVGRLVDADMNEASTRLKAIETQRQLAHQTLSIANSNLDHVVQLFR